VIDPTDAVIHLGTADDTGRIRSTPVWFIADGDDLIVYSRADARRAARIPLRPKVTVRAERAGAKALAGTARIDPSLPPPDRNAAYLEKYRVRIEKGLKQTLEGFARKYPVPLRIRLDRS
jgi:PPOX class probable F420-dependent enzyme